MRRAVRRSFYVLFSIVGITRWLLDRGASISGDPREILVVRVDLLGDVLFCLPAVQALRTRYPDARITMLTLPYTAPVARMCPALDEVVPVDTNAIRSLVGLLDLRTWAAYWRTWRYLRSRKIDLAISIYGRMGSLCAFLSGARRTVGYATESYPLLLTDPVSGGRHHLGIHEIEYALRLAQHAGAAGSGDRPQLLIPEPARRRAVGLLASHSISDTDRVVVVHPGSVNGSAKRWPAAYWAQFIHEITVRQKARVVLVGAKADLPIADDVLARSSAGAASLVGETDLPELAALLDRAELFAGGDSGPLHLAAALGRPVVAVYGPTDPAVYGPYPGWTESVVSRADIPCSPCYTLAATAECPLADPICMRLVPVDRLVADASALLGKALYSQK